MKKTTLGHIEYDGKWLMLYRDIDKGDGSQGKWLGVGGKCEPGETPRECFIREAFEETGIALSDCRLCGAVDYINDMYVSERMYLFTAYADSAEFSECDEGILRWIPREEIMSLNMWEGDKYFLEPMLKGEENIAMTLTYHGDELTGFEPGVLRLGEEIL
ncbi:MAG: 8-oxo-dGTP diphosphatase [Parasporobacterium sp.]|nr:8-oxo-dGTP diphosphatase [Parasporobacterium sp.]